MSKYSIRLFFRQLGILAGLQVVLWLGAKVSNTEQLVIWATINIVQVVIDAAKRDINA